MTYSAELLSLFDSRFLDRRTRDQQRIDALKERLGDRTPEVIEIGCERGDFLIGLARTHPESTVLGVEWRAGFARYADERMQRLGYANALVASVNAKLLFPLLPLASVQEVHVTFPDPWWKEKHVARRLLDPLFLRVIARRLAPGGRLYLKSDVFDYLYRVRAFAERSGAFRPLPAEHWPDERTWTWTTRERKCMQAAIPFGRGYYVVREDWDRALPVSPECASDFALDEDVDPIALIRGAPPVDKENRERIRAMQAKARAADEGHVDDEVDAEEP